jgi:L-iditol 2-dehydrogenase
MVVRAEEATPDTMRAANGGHSFDLVVTCAGTRSVAEQAFQLAGRGGTVLLFAPLEPGTIVSLPMFDIWREQITIVSTYAGCPADIEEAIGMIETGMIEVADMITHRLPLEETGRGFRLVAEGRESIKVIITPQEQGHSISIE